MIKANFNAYASYVTDSLYQWDINQVLAVRGINVEYTPEVHFSNANMDKAIVRQATRSIATGPNYFEVDIPNSLLQHPLTIRAHVGTYEGDTFKVLELIEIPVIARTRPADYQIEDADEEIYSFKALENAINNRLTINDFNRQRDNLNHRIDNIIAYASETESNTELIDIRTDASGTVHASAGTAVREQYNAAIKRNHNATVFVNNPPTVNFTKNVSVEITLTGNTIIFYNSKTYNVSARTVTNASIENQALFCVIYNIANDELKVQYYATALQDNDVIIGTIYEDRLFLNYIGKNTYGTSKVPDSLMPAMPYIWSDNPIEISAVDNGNNWTLSLEITSAINVVEGLQTYTIQARTLEVNTDAKNYLYKLLYNPLTDTMRFMYHGDKHSDVEIIIAMWHPTWGVHVNGRAYCDGNYNLSLTPVIMGSGNKFVEIDTVNGTVTFPNDTLLLTNRAGKNVYYGLFENNNNLTATFDPSGSSAIIVYYDIDTQSLETCIYSTRLKRNALVLASIRTKTGSVSILAPYKINGKPYNLDAEALGIGEISYNVKSINHRGYNTEAPENTLSAFKLSKEKGFKYVECDVAFTSDNVGVVLHDTTVDRTSEGTGPINGMTLEEVKALDFGSWFSFDYVGETIPTFEEFILLCRNIGLHPYIELKAGSEAEIKSLVDTVKRYGMARNVTWISFYSTVLGYINKYDSKARIGFVCDSLSENSIETAVSLRTDTNEVFIDAGSGSVTPEMVEICVANDLPLEVWTVNTESALIALDPYVSGVTSDSLNAGRVLHNANMG